MRTTQGTLLHILASLARNFAPKANEGDTGTAATTKKPTGYGRPGVPSTHGGFLIPLKRNP